STFEYSTNGGGNWEIGTGSSFEVPAGDYNLGDVQVKTTDNAGNEHTESLGAITVDKAIAKPTISTITDNANDSDDKVDLIGTAEANSNIDLYLNDVKIVSNVAVNSSGNWKTEYTVDTAGTLKFEVKSTDLAGNESVLSDSKSMEGYIAADPFTMGGTTNDIIIGKDTSTPDYLLDGDAGDDIIFGREGDDALIGGAGSDELYGGEDNDNLTYDKDDKIIDGGEDDDTLIFSAGDTSTIADILNNVTNIEIININDSDQNLGQINLSDIISITDNNNKLEILSDGSGNNNVTLDLASTGGSGEWQKDDSGEYSNASSITIGSNTFSAGTIQLLIDDDDVNAI
ncbi:MAG: hypothetical protein GY932_04935, partial [Arcobacter sp.]|nr:hypothetical protein [Arcobacter sp.]